MTMLDTQGIAESSCAQALFAHVLCLAFSYSFGLVQKSQLHSTCHADKPERCVLHSKDCFALPQF